MAPLAWGEAVRRDRVAVMASSLGGQEGIHPVLAVCGVPGGCPGGSGDYRADSLGGVLVTGRLGLVSAGNYWGSSSCHAQGPWAMTGLQQNVYL